MRNFLLLACVTLMLGLSACGGGDSAPATPVATQPAATPPAAVTPAANQVVTTVGPGVSQEPNTLNVSVTICVPGTSNCQTIPNILVDTGSFGLRLFASSLTIPLPTSTTGGGTLTNCAQFGLGTTYGSVQLADVKLAGETASNTAIQVVADPNFSAVPVACANGGVQNVTSPATLKSNGILGIGAEPIDCASCEANASGSVYYICTSASSCTPTAVPAALQVTNPIANFSQDNNGVLVTLPSVTSAGSDAVNGMLTFGIGTQADNALGTATIYTITPYAPGAQFYDTFATTFNGGATTAFIDSGSNGFFFQDAAIAPCTVSTGFYCPASTLNLSAVMQGVNGTNSSQNFSIADAQPLFDNGKLAANNIGGPGAAGYFDWGLPFFYGRTVFYAIDGRATPGGTGPYFAF